MMKDRYEDEIEQILRNLDAQPPKSNAEQPATPSSVTPVDDEPSPFAPKPPARKRLISPAKLSFIGVVLAVIGLALTKLVWLSVAGLVIIVVAVVWMFLQRATTPANAAWRGRPVEQPPQTGWQRFRQWLSR